jgi:hypothetical protein
VVYENLNLGYLKYIVIVCHSDCAIGGDQCICQPVRRVESFPAAYFTIFAGLADLHKHSAADAGNLDAWAI